MKLHLLILVPIFTFLSLESCKKNTQQSTPSTSSSTSTSTKTPSPIVADPVDTLIGTYTGTMCIMTHTIIPGHVVSADSTSPATNYYDTTSYITSYSFSKVSSDSFDTGDLFWLMSQSGTTYNPSYHLKYDSSGVYVNNWSETDTLKTIISADSIYYSHKDEALEDGGYTYTSITVKIFSGKK